jgi:hypothetical protein
MPPGYTHCGDHHHSETKTSAVTGRREAVRPDGAEVQHLGGELARLEVAERGLGVGADQALGPLVRGLVRLGDAEPPVEQERQGDLALGVPLLVDLVEGCRAELLGLLRGAARSWRWRSFFVSGSRPA